MSKFNTTAEVAQGAALPADKQQTAYTPTVRANALLPFTQAVLKALPLPVIVLAVGVPTLIVTEWGWKFWLWFGGLVLALFAFLISKSYPERLRIADTTLHNLEMLLHQDLNNDSFIGAHPAKVNTTDERLTEARKIERTRADFRAFVTQAGKRTTVRALHAAGWKNDEKNELYRNWLFTIVRMPDGNPAAHETGRGEWGLAYPVADVLAAVEKLEWISVDHKAKGLV